MDALRQDNFILCSDASVQLYREHACGYPVIDFHTHLSPQVFAANTVFKDVAELWVVSDPYKWRAMRIHGIPERFISGDASAKEKFRAWAHTLPHLAGNPLYDWARLEMKQHFGLDELPCPDNADRLMEICNQRLRENEVRPQSVLLGAGVEAFVTSDAWLDTLEWHHRVLEEGRQPRMRPSLRADDAFAFDSPGYREWLVRLGNETGHAIGSLGGFLRQLRTRLDAFAAAGCVLSDHGLDVVRYAACTESEGETIFQFILKGQQPTQAESAQLETFLLLWLAGEYAERGWTMQLHIGARRQTSSRLAAAVGKAGGYAVMRASVDDTALVSLLDAMEGGAGLPRTILYSLNANDYDWMASLSGSFVQDGVAGKVQLGPAWWYNDHHDGIERQLRAVSAYGVLKHCVGMNTDSRSFLSCVRHDYFRRILCNLLGMWVEAGRVSFDDLLNSDLLGAICHRNARAMLEPLTRSHL